MTSWTKFATISINFTLKNMKYIYPCGTQIMDAKTTATIWLDAGITTALQRIFTWYISDHFGGSIAFPKSEVRELSRKESCEANLFLCYGQY